MEKRVEVEITEIEFEHEFYCDKCGTFLGKSEEYDDGYYAEIGQHCWEYRHGDIQLIKEGQFCETCYKEINSHINSTLEQLGFLPERS